MGEIDRRESGAKGLTYLEALLGGAKVEWKPLGEVCVHIFSGHNQERDPNGAYPVYGSTGIIARTNQKEYNTTQILVARVGVNAGYVHIATGEYAVSDNTLIVQHKEILLLRFLYYFLTKLNLNKLAYGGAQPLISASLLKKQLIPIPPPPRAGAYRRDIRQIYHAYRSARN